MVSVELFASRDAAFAEVVLRRVRRRLVRGVSKNPAEEPAVLEEVLETDLCLLPVVVVGIEEAVDVVLEAPRGAELPLAGVLAPTLLLKVVVVREWRACWRGWRCCCCC